MKRIRQSCLLWSLFLWPAPLPTQQPAEVVPQATVQTNPTYPPIARTAHIQGDVRVKVTTDGTSVLSAEADSGPPLLRKASEDAARTWKFVPHPAGSFHLTFHYMIMGDQLALSQGTGVVVVVASPPQLIVEYASIDLGIWQARRRGQNGVSRFAVRLFSTGERGQWLIGNLVGTDGKCVEIDSGTIDGEIIAITVKQPISDAKTLSTIYTGRIKDDKIVGAFVDDSGTTGTWTATRADASDMQAISRFHGCSADASE